MRTGVRLRAVIFVLVLVVAVAVVAVTLPTLQREEQASEPAYQQASDGVNLVSVGGSEARLWPYTSRQRRFDTRTLGINVIVMEDAATVRRVLAADERSGWQVSDPENESVAHPGDEPIVVNGSGVAWNQTTGATRYTYVQTDEGGRWLDETIQLHDGAYLGSRYHIRMYEVAAGEDTWTAIQVHHEHWDWFRLRHTVGSVARGRYAVEHQFYGTELISEISRKRFGNGGTLDADGWVTIVDLIDWKLRSGGAGSPGAAAARSSADVSADEAVSAGTSADMASSARLSADRASSAGVSADGLATAGVVLGLVAVATRATSLAASAREVVERNPTTVVHVALFLALLAIPVAVRVGAIELERASGGLSPKVVAAPFYLVLAVGLPVTAGLLGRRLPADEAFAVAVVGLGFGILADYAILGISYLPYWVVVHRIVLLLGIGLVAAGGVRWSDAPLHRHRYRLLGIAIWIAALLWPLAGG